MKKSRMFYRYIALVVFSILLNTPHAFAEALPPTKAELSGTVNQQVSQELTNTGDNVNAESKQENRTETTVTNTNTTTVDQSTSVNANTGGNTANRNISIGGNAGVIQTGTIGVATTAVAGGVQNTTASQQSAGSASGQTTTVTNTGDGVSASNNSQSTNTTTVNNTNNTTANQTTTVNANTGNNQADRNISIGGNAGVIQTGSVGVQSNYLITPTRNATIIGGNSNGNGPGSGASIVLNNTGDKVSANSNTTDTNTTNVNNINNSYVNQLTEVNANTGNNTASRNISIGGDAGVIRTGSVLVGANYAVDGSTNQTYVDGGSSGGSGGSSTGLANTGNGVNTSSSENNQTSTSVANTNNTFINQQAFINANTGGNDASRNINTNGDAGTITTGGVGVFVSFLADFSKNTTYVSPTANHYMYLPSPTTAAAPTPQVQYQRQTVYYPVEQEKIYYVYVNQQPRSNYASYAYPPQVMGAMETNPYYVNENKAKVAVQESSPTTMSVGGVSQLMVMLVSLGALGLRKMMRV